MLVNVLSHDLQVLCGAMAISFLAHVTRDPCPEMSRPFATVVGEWKKYLLMLYNLKVSPCLLCGVGATCMTISFLPQDHETSESFSNKPATEHDAAADVEARGSFRGMVPHKLIATAEAALWESRLLPKMPGLILQSYWWCNFWGAQATPTNACGRSFWDHSTCKQTEKCRQLLECLMKVLCGHKRSENRGIQATPTNVWGQYVRGQAERDLVKEESRLLPRMPVVGPFWGHTECSRHPGYSLECLMMERLWQWMMVVPYNP